MFYVYMVECRDGTIYTGWTKDVEKRISRHNSGQGAKYTKSRLPVRLRHVEEFPTKEEAMSREYSIKKLTRKDKLHLFGQCH
ncbi:Excinuclease ABC C subunit domain protein [Syntrophobotulus glycolicus DSM 8271]|uniref:Excinuclease ABC C subunit domain protein n=1 Tax=Syntrophobotulus glycolicus (strain DSM 8271 / FlGlyR) TaxID=645991 RepID=F0T0G8_SYNGF|nr:GIY-YIG nuclease family protein [Syntrophobotulus glycolicus]ADY57340.1 Excinuclease ABC C subunit domain protein [Syntrophobotulus glycolicus DSM 8271]